MDELKPISYKEFNVSIKGRGFKRKNDYASKNLKAMFGFKSLKAKIALVVSSEDMEATKFSSMREAAKAIGMGERVIESTRNLGREGQKHLSVFDKVVPHIKCVYMQTHLLGLGSNEVPHGQTFNYESGRDWRMKIWMHKKFCDKWPGLSFTSQPGKAMIEKEAQCMTAERSEFRA